MKTRYLGRHWAWADGDLFRVRWINGQPCLFNWSLPRKSLLWSAWFHLGKAGEALRVLFFGLPKEDA